MHEAFQAPRLQLGEQSGDAFADRLVISVQQVAGQLSAVVGVEQAL